MKSKYLAAALSFCMTLGMVSPALADDEPLDKVVDGSLMVTRVGGLGAGWVVGTPVAVMRSSYKSYIDFTQAAADKVGGKDCGPCCLLVSLGTLPAGLVVGTLKGAYYGGKNGIVHGFNEPFSPASFSLKELDE